MERTVEIKPQQRPASTRRHFTTGGKVETARYPHNGENLFLNLLSLATLANTRHGPCFPLFPRTYYDCCYFFF